MKVAIYDLDKTLVRRATFTPFLVFAARKLAPWRLILLPVWVLLMLGYRAGFYDRTRLKTAGMRMMLGKQPVSRIEQIGEAFADHHIAQAGWIKPVTAMLEADRAEGARIILATAAFDFYAKAFARRLSVDEVIATCWDGRSIPGGNCYGATKLEKVTAWLGSAPVSHDLKFVSDSFADAPLLDVAGDPVFVTRSVSKRTRAEAKGWRVIAP